MPTISLLDLKLKIIKNHLTRISSNVVDAFFENVVLLLRGNGDNGGQNNTFLDSSANNFAITRNGNATQGTFSPYGDNWSNYFDGTGDLLTTPDNAAFDFGTGDFTIECWVYIAGNSTTDAGGLRTATVIGAFQASGSPITTSYGFTINGSTTTTGTGLAFSLWQSGVNYVITATTTVTQHAWHHVAVARSGTVTKLFLDGSEVGSGTLGNQNVDTAFPITIGRIAYTGYLNELNGYISNLRVLKGTAQYTGSYIVPTAPLTAIANTSLLTCQSNRFIDKSTNNFTITQNGNVAVERFSPFSPTAAYAAGTIGGSGYFDGTGDYLSAAYNSVFDITSGNFCVEAWVYRDVIGTEHYILSQRQDAPNSGWELRINTLNTVTFLFTGGSSLSSTKTIPAMTWTHLAVTRETNTVRMFINGALETSSIFSNGTATTSQLYIGSTTSAPQTYFRGHICDARIIKGSSVYTVAFTPPTTPLTAITNTSLLLNFTNTAIADNAMMANLETVGNSQISTSIKKYGTGSLYFDGTGDYLSGPASQDYVFGTGDFTVEYWVYPLVNTTGCMVDLRTTETGNGSVAYSDFFTAAGKLGLYINANTYTSTSTVPTNQWTHIAVSRSGSALRVFFNGVQDGATVNNSQNLMGGALKIGTNVAIGGVFTGYLDEIRITKGVARYTSNFTPPTEQFPDL